MKRSVCIFLLVFAVMFHSSASDGVIQNPYGRDFTSLNGCWKAFADPQNIGMYNFHGAPLSVERSYFADVSGKSDMSQRVEYDFDSAGDIRVPGDWNTQKEKLYYYEGTMWYRKKFDFSPKQDKRYFLYFGAVNYKCGVALNARMLGFHKGGFTPFNYEVTDYIKGGSNSLVLSVDNSRGDSEVPTSRFDWWNYGGITRDVMLIEVPSVFIRDYSVSYNAGKSKEIIVQAYIDGASSGEEFSVNIPELKIKRNAVSDEKGHICIKIKANPKLWSPESPKLYDVILSTSQDSVTDQVGFRTIETEGSRILLNGSPIFLKGVAVHEETLSEMPGRVTTKEEAEKLVALAKSMGCNFLRLAHYPHGELMIRAAEKAGVMVWDEIPCYWAIDWTNPETYSNAETQLKEMIDRDKNRANVIIWSVANETPKGDARLKFLRSLIEKVRSLDSTRLVSAALLTSYLDKATSRISVDDDLAEYTDLLCFNEYIGWYDGNPSHCREMKWEFPIEKPVVITEFGGGARYGYQGDEKHRFTEQHLEKIYEAQLEMFSRIPNLVGLCPWVLKDFRSPRRLLPGIQDEFNRKGLVDEKGNRKKAFYVMKKYYTERYEK